MIDIIIENSNKSLEEATKTISSICYQLEMPQVYIHSKYKLPKELIEKYQNYVKIENGTKNIKGDYLLYIEVGDYFTNPYALKNIYKYCEENDVEELLKENIVFINHNIKQEKLIINKKRERQMKKLTIVAVNSSLEIKTENEEIEIIETTAEDIRDAILIATGKYICFICNDDRVSENYFDLIYEKSKENFDCCYINNTVDIGIKRENKRNNSQEYLSSIKPYFLEYIWQFLFKTSVLKKIINFEYNYEFDEKIDKIIKKSTAIEEIIYFHNGNNTEFTLEGVPYVDYKNIEYYKNILYLRDYLAGTFSGLITWIMNIGRCFGKEYDITLLYDDIFPETEVKFRKYIRTVRREKFTNYVCERFIDTYLDYDFPRNIFYNEESSTFVHGIMGDEDLKPDLYDRYIAVSDTCRKTVTLGFETDKKPEYIHNPIKIEDNMVRPHLKLVSTQRSENIKGLDRLEKVAKILDEENIPYTWNVFTDVNEGTNTGGFIYRNCVFNPLSYVQDSDYLVLLSDTEAFCYSVAEALLLNTKVVVTPLDVFNELGVKDRKNGYVIPFEYFEDNNKEKLREKVIEIYQNKEKEINDELAPLNFNKFGELFIK